MKAINLRGITVTALLVYFLLSQAPVYAQSAAQSGSSDKNWVRLDKYDFPVWLVSFLPPKGDGVNTGDFFLYTESTNFTPDNILKITRQIASDNKPSPTNPFAMLRITIFSDKEMIDRAVLTTMYPICRRFADTAEGKKAEQEFYEKIYPLPSGYYRAHFLRESNGRVTLQFSPNPQSEKLIVLPFEDK